MDQGTDWEETAAAAVSSQFGVGNQNPYNPETSDFLFSGLLRGEENESASTHLQQPSEENSAIMNQNLQCFEAWNPNHPANAPMPVAEPCVLPGFQETFGRRKPLMNQLTQHPNASSKMQCSGINHLASCCIQFQ
ncbi:hypothetical protein CDAR_175441 [Caerostris darwini]|uniref:Uncharacterized protein n=1 Tax=Caerostris darwini TaxID=1538125 RepID=A0AAV4W018_9ARAC|nr:hypothetical protein CDAR_175441 [Caerostris darwini]